MALDTSKSYWAYDLSKDALKQSEVVDEGVINQSIEMILATTYGERVFNPYFGSNFPLILFEGFSEQRGEAIIRDFTEALEKWEDRIVLDKENIKLKFFSSDGILEIFIPYVIKKEQVKSFFLKKIVV